MESQGTPDSQNNLERKQTWGPCASQFQKILMKQQSNKCDTGIKIDTQTDGTEESAKNKFLHIWHM